MYKILVIEDNTSLAESIALSLGNRYETTIATNGADGYSIARNNQFDAILLDLKLPQKSGLTILRMLRHSNIDTPIIVLSSEQDTGHIQTCFLLGCNQFLSKPFSIKELHARVKAIIKRKPKTQSLSLLKAGFNIDPNTFVVRSNSKSVQLRKREFEILTFMIERNGNTVTRDQLLNNLWSLTEEPFSSTIDVHISNLRRKLGKITNEEIIATVHGKGYRFKEPVEVQV